MLKITYTDSNNVQHIIFVEYQRTTGLKGYYIDADFGYSGMYQTLCDTVCAYLGSQRKLVTFDVII
jgi:hypothetical protein